jgi:hypothetical protein
MDLYTFILELILIIGTLNILAGFLYYFGIRPQTKRLIEESKKLQLKLNQIKAEMGEDGGSGFVTGALGDVGIDGILDSIGIPAPFKSLAKGFIDNLLKDPEKIKALADKIGIKLPGNEEKPGFF